MIKINDTHLHITYKPTTIYSHYTFDYFLKDKSKYVANTVLFLNPIYSKLYPCKIGHRYTVYDLDDNQNLMFKCDECSNISYVGPDPYREDNIKLLKDCYGKPGLYPYIYLTISNNTLPKEFEFFEKNYKGMFYGIKVHPNLCSRKMSEIKFDSGYPMVVHCGIGIGDDPKDIAKFAKNYSGNVMFAHFAKFDVKALEEIAKLPNAFIDTSPLYLAKDILNKSTKEYYPSKITEIEDLTALIKNLIAIVGEDKVVFGSDCPWGSQTDCIELYQKLNLPQTTKNKIFYENFNRFNVVRTLQSQLESSEQDVEVKNERIENNLNR